MTAAAAVLETDVQERPQQQFSSANNEDGRPGFLSRRQVRRNADNLLEGEDDSCKGGMILRLSCAPPAADYFDSLEDAIEEEEEEEEAEQGSSSRPHESEELEDLLNTSSSNNRQRHEAAAAATTGSWQLSMQQVARLLLATVSKSCVLTCQAAAVQQELEESRRREGGEAERREEETVHKQALQEILDMTEIGWPTDVEHIAHVTFDRCHGFLGLPQEYENEVPRTAPSASQSVFGVSPESMQCSYDLQGNMIPTILLLLQKRLYEKGGLKAEGIFRINVEHGHEDFVQEQVNMGIVPTDNIDVHVLASLIKAWFRELPKAVLDELSPEAVLRCRGEKETLALIKHLPSTEAALLDWAVNLMADVVEEEPSNKMNARSIATIFAPNMTQMTDPLTALIHVVQVMNLLNTLIVHTLKRRQAARTSKNASPVSSPEITTTESQEHEVLEDCSNAHVQQHDEKEQSSGVEYLRDKILQLPW